MAVAKRGRPTLPGRATVLERRRQSPATHAPETTQGLWGQLLSGMAPATPGAPATQPVSLPTATSRREERMFPSQEPHPATSLQPSP